MALRRDGLHSKTHPPDPPLDAENKTPGRKPSSRDGPPGARASFGPPTPKRGSAGSTMFTGTPTTGSRDSASLSTAASATSTSLSSRKLRRNSGGSDASSGYAAAEAGGLVGEEGAAAEIPPVPPLPKGLSAYKTPLMSAGVTFPGSGPHMGMGGGESGFESASEVAGSDDPDRTVVFPSMSMTITSPTSPPPPVPTRQPSKKWSFSNALNLRLPSGSPKDSLHVQKELPNTPQKDAHGYVASPQKTPRSQGSVSFSTFPVDTSSTPGLVVGARRIGALWSIRRRTPEAGDHHYPKNSRDSRAKLPKDTRNDYPTFPQNTRGTITCANARCVERLERKHLRYWCHSTGSRGVNVTDVPSPTKLDAPSLVALSFIAGVRVPLFAIRVFWDVWPAERVQKIERVEFGVKFPKPIPPKSGLTPPRGTRIIPERLFIKKNMATLNNSANNYGYDDERGDYLVMSIAFGHPGKHQKVQLNMHAFIVRDRMTSDWAEINLDLHAKVTNLVRNLHLYLYRFTNNWATYEIMKQPAQKDANEDKDEDQEGDQDDDEDGWAEVKEDGESSGGEQVKGNDNDKPVHNDKVSVHEQDEPAHDHNKLMCDNNTNLGDGAASGATDNSGARGWSWAGEVNEEEEEVITVKKSKKHKGVAPASDAKMEIFALQVFSTLKNTSPPGSPPPSHKTNPFKTKVLS
ncbi:hypothetical protein FRC06_011720 [Ceratobasidium sp. 370]|nr:hypothetical protein FRC06_011720 [Ceratobasidium sp. 370]